MTHQTYVYRVGRVVKVVDGDTVDLELVTSVDVGFHVTAEYRLVQRIRLAGVDTPERGQPGWAEATQAVKDWFLLVLPSNLVCRTVKGDSFGRYIGDIEDSVSGTSLSQHLLDTGHGVPYGRRQVD